MVLTDEEAFEARRAELGETKRSEDVWQSFFEQNTWIFGYGLNYYFNSPLDGRQLEQVLKGYDFAASGKRVDALLKTNGFVSALSFVEIKTHKTGLIKKVKRPYRAESWQISDDLAGGLSQVQRTVQVSLENIRTRTDVTGSDGAPTGERLFLYQPRAVLVVGSLGEFQGEHGINDEQYSSFEMFRRNIVNPEIITFYELYERARCIVDSGERLSTMNGRTPRSHPPARSHILSQGAGLTRGLDSEVPVVRRAPRVKDRQDLDALVAVGSEASCLINSERCKHTSFCTHGVRKGVDPYGTVQ